MAANFNALNDKIGKLLNDTIYHIPRNQRAYVWNEQNWNDMYRDFNFVASQHTDIPHFIGSIVLKEEASENGLNVFSVIDGQQRIITLTVLLANIFFEFKRRNRNNEANGMKKYFVTNDLNGKRKEIVSFDKYPGLEQLIEKIIDIPEESANKTSLNYLIKQTLTSSQEKKITDAFAFFDEKIKLLNDDMLLSMRDAIIGADCIRIKAATEEDSYTIFEILNARGMELEDYELLRNYLMRYISPEPSRDAARKKWEELEQKLGNSRNNMSMFLKHYVIHKFDASKRNKKKDYLVIRDGIDPLKAQDLLNDLTMKAGYYKRIIDPDLNTFEGKIFHFIKSQRVRIFRPLLMSLMSCLDKEKITNKQYENSLEFIREFYICYKIIGGLESNNLTDSVSKYAYKLENESSIGILEEWHSAFKSKMPDIETFKNKMRDIGWSHNWPIYEGSKNKDKCKFVLSLLNEAEGDSRPMGDFTIEHITPDSEEQKNALIGNLIPLEKNLNKRCKNLSLSNKISIYQESNYKSVKSFIDHHPEESFDAYERSERIATTIYNFIQSE